jgi:hypothetical protein
MRIMSNSISLNWPNINRRRWYSPSWMPSITMTKYKKYDWLQFKNPQSSFNRNKRGVIDKLTPIIVIAGLVLKNCNRKQLKTTKIVNFVDKTASLSISRWLRWRKTMIFSPKSNRLRTDSASIFKAGRRRDKEIERIKGLRTVVNNGLRLTSISFDMILTFHI